MDTATLIPFLALVALGTYVQTVSGFALGLIVMGTVTTLQLAPVHFTAVVISVISLFNTLLALRHSHHHVQWREVTWVLLGMLPAVVAGVILLGTLSSRSTQLLHTLLAAFILVGATLLLLKPHPRQQASGPLSALFIGTIAGLFSGLFSTAGPPMVYHLYRQPYSVATIRSTLFSVFAISTSARILYVGWEGGISASMWQMSLWCLPVVMVATWLGRHFPPPLADIGMRRLAYGLLLLLGLSLLLSEL